MTSVAYIIYSKKLDKYYVGQSDNFVQRLQIHNSDENEKWSKAGRPWVEFLVIECKCKKQSLRIEKYIKAQKSRKYIESLKARKDYVENLLKRFANDC